MVESPVHRVYRSSREAVKRLAGCRVTLRRFDGIGGVKTGVVERAVLGETRTTDFVENNIAVVVRFRDFLIDVSEYVIDGLEVIPQVDDQVEMEVNGSIRRYQVLPAPGEGEYERSDRLGIVWRVHTREIIDGNS